MITDPPTPKAPTPKTPTRKTLTRPGGRPLPENEPRDDWLLLAQAADGDAAAFGALVRRHQDRLLRLCERLLGRRALAEEAVQEVFLKLHGKASRFEPRGQLYTLLYRMATNHCLNQLRRRRIARFVPFASSAMDDAEAFDLDPEDDSPDPHSTLVARRRWQATLERLEALPPGQRAVVVLVKLEGHSYKETAQLLGITLGAVESRLFRAMRTLEEALSEEERTAVDRPGAGLVSRDRT